LTLAPSTGSPVSRLTRWPHPHKRIAATRIADKDLGIDGFVMPTGTLLFANTAAAESDPADFEHPNHLDITRDDAV
jgi:cytochrome P450